MSPSSLQASHLAAAPHRCRRESVTTPAAYTTTPTTATTSNPHSSRVRSAASSVRARRRDSVGSTSSRGEEAAGTKGLALSSVFKTGGAPVKPCFSTARRAQLSGRRGHVSRTAVQSPSAMAAPAPSQVATASVQSRQLRVFELETLSKEDRDTLLLRPRIDFSSILATVSPIVEDVRTRGDAAVKEYTTKFDKVNLTETVVEVASLPEPQLPPDVKEAFDIAFENIRKFHAAQMPKQTLEVETMPGVVCRRVSRPIQSVGLYVPGGTAVLPSTALMLAVPAGLAKCKTIVVATPPRPDGSICPEVLYCCKRAGATHILQAGGAQAVAAMAWGTESCPKVTKILGPGNQYVTAAKMLLQNSEAMISIDMPAGPSEVLVICDSSASPVHVASDLLSQAEHGPDSQVVLVVIGKDADVAAISQEVQCQLALLPRGSIAAKALDHSYAVTTNSVEEAFEFSNLYAPEHLIVNIQDPEASLPLVSDAGSVFLGPWTPESVGDYASGTNHVLPTYGYARMYGGVSLDSFMKYMTVQSLTEQGLRNLGPAVAKMAEVEGLDAHKQAVTLRLADLK